MKCCNRGGRILLTMIHYRKHMHQSEWLLMHTKIKNVADPAIAVPFTLTAVISPSTLTHRLQPTVKWQRMLGHVVWWGVGKWLASQNSIKRFRSGQHSLAGFGPCTHLTVLPCGVNVRTFAGKQYEMGDKLRKEHFCHLPLRASSPWFGYGHHEPHRYCALCHGLLGGV